MPPACGGLIHRPAGQYLPREEKLWGEIATGQSQRPFRVPHTTRIWGKNILLSLLKQHLLNSYDQSKWLELALLPLCSDAGGAYNVRFTKRQARSLATSAP